jgi:S1-C subfamily serine protease
VETNQKPRITRFSGVLIATVMVVGLVAAGLLSYSVGNSDVSGKVADLESELSAVQKQLSNLQSTQNTTDQDSTFVIGENASLSALYDQVKDSVVIVRGMMLQSNGFVYYYAQVQGSGFVYNSSGKIVIVTNYHVVQSAVNITVTFLDGNGYSAAVLGSDPYADLAVLSANATQGEYKPLEMVSSSTLEVGDPVIAVGNPYGLAGSMTNGIVSAMGRTITEDMTGSYPIADIIQTSTPINSGNSGGPLLNYQGQVIGITTAIISNSQGLGFAIPSSTILREIELLITKGSYDQHPWLGANGTDMTFEIAEAMGVNVTYGWLITQISSGGPAYQAGLQAGTERVVVTGSYVTIGGDIITVIDGVRIKNLDDLSTYLEEHTLPDQTVNVTIVQGKETMSVLVKLGTRPSLGAGI